MIHILDQNNIHKILLFVLLFLVSACDKEITTSPPEEPPPQGFIFVDSNPHKYQIYLDGRFTGRFTPDTLIYIQEKEHYIELKRKYWLDSNGTVTAKYKTVDSVYVDFFQNPKIYGELWFYSQPEGAYVEIDDSLTTIRTPGKLSKVLPGLHTVRYKLPGHRGNSTRVVVESNKRRSISLALQDTSIWVDYTVKNSSLPNNHITTLAVDSNNVIWAGTVSKGIVSIKGNRWESLNAYNSILPSNRIRVIEIDKDNTVWIGTDEGLVEYSNGAIRNIYDYTNTKLLRNSQINDIKFLRDKVIAGTAEGLLIISSDGSSELFEVENTEGKSVVNSIVVSEKFGFVLVGIKGLLLSLTIKDGEIEGTLKRRNILKGVEDLELTKLIIRPADGKVWALFSYLSDINYTGDLVFLPPYLTAWNGSNWLYQRLDEEELILRDATVSSDNFVWVATNQGLRKQETIRIAVKIQSYNTGLFSDDLTAIEEDRNGVLWIGSEDGLFKYKRFK